jgi:hypothetical protein
MCKRVKTKFVYYFRNTPSCCVPFCMCTFQLIQVYGFLHGHLSVISGCMGQGLLSAHTHYLVCWAGLAQTRLQQVCPFQAGGSSDSHVMSCVSSLAHEFKHATGVALAGKSLYVLVDSENSMIMCSTLHEQSRDFALLITPASFSSTSEINRTNNEKKLP